MFQLPDPEGVRVPRTDRHVFFFGRAGGERRAIGSGAGVAGSLQCSCLLMAFLVAMVIAADY